ncbi:MAG: hypothetical protein WC333_00805 [Dehalococcoidia bacterium]
MSGMTGANENEIYSNSYIPSIQPLYYWKATGISGSTGVLVPNSEAWIASWERHISPKITTDFADYGEVLYLSAVTDTKLNITDYVSYTAATDSRLDSIESDITGITANMGLQEVTEINATTTVESSFNGGIVVNEIRPSGGTASEITVNKADGITPIITIDTISGFTGFGTATPNDIIHVYGTDTSELGHRNGITLDGVANGDKILSWAESGNPKWHAKTCRCENGQFWYLYNEEGGLSTLTVSESGRIGVNSVTNNINYPPVLITGSSYSAYANLVISGKYDKNFIGVYQVKIDSITGITDTYIWRRSINLGSSYGVWSSPLSATTGTTVIDSGIEVSFVNPTGNSLGDTWQFAAFPQLAPATLSVTGNRVDRVIYTTNYTTYPPQYIVGVDITGVANSSTIDSPLQLFQTGTTLNAAYVGTVTKLNSLFLNIPTPGVGMTLVVEYWNGTSWVDISIGNEFFLDGTNNVSQSGAITWNVDTMTGWIPYDGRNSGELLYWLRFRTSSPPTIAPYIGSVSRGSSQRFSIYASAFDYKPAFYVDALGRINVGGGNITGSNKLQVNTGNNVQVTTTGTDSLVEFDSEDSNVVDLKIKLASNDACAPGLTFVKTRGTLDASSCTQTGDLLGRISFRGRSGTSGRLLAEINSQFTGAPTARCGDIFFKTANGSDPLERVRIDYKGDTGFGVSTPTALVHLKSGTTTNAPLKFTSGTLLTTPQAGAVEFQGEKFYGTTTGGTRQRFAFMCDTNAINLQTVTEIGAVTTVETCFNGGLVVNEIRPSGGTASAITINKADGVTPIITINTTSGLTGFGTVEPDNIIHIYGVDNSNGSYISTHKNGIIIDGVADGDKDVVWRDDGAEKWFAEIYRGEEGKFWYLYNSEGDLSPLTISESGRIGVNSPSNIIDYPAQSVGSTPYNNGLVIGGLYDKSYIAIYEVRIDSTTGVTDTYQWRVSSDLNNTYTAWSTPTGCTTGATIIDSGVEVSFVQITGFVVGDAWRFATFPQLAPSTFTVTGNRVNKVLATLDYTASAVTFSDFTAEVNTSVVDVPTPMFETGVTTNAAYIGTNTKLNSLFINVIQGGEGITLVGEYWDGNSWENIGTSSGYFNDTTNNLTQTGYLTWNTNALTNWTYAEPLEMPGEGEYYWVRIRTASPSTVTPLIGGVSRGSNMRFAVYASAMDYRPSFYVDALGRTSIGGGNLTGRNVLQVNTNKNYQVYSGASSLVEFDNEDSSIALLLKLRQASDDACGPALLLTKSRGTLSGAVNPQYDDNMGCITWGSPINGCGFVTAKIISKYIGDGSTYYGDLRFAVANGQNLVQVEKIRVSGAGVGFGGIVPTALVHLQSGTTAANTAPLKFTSGLLLATPESGAVEFQGDKFYGTTTGGTRREFAYTCDITVPDLQEVTEVGASTTVESSFNGGIVVNEIRPFGGTASAITINKADGITPIITINTISGFTGIGITNPVKQIHLYGTDLLDDGGYNTQANGLNVDGPTGADKDVVWLENGEPKWFAETFRGENAEFWYLYNMAGNTTPIVASESGRVGVNSPSNYFSFYANKIIGTGLNDLYVDGIYDKTFISNYEIRISGVTGTTDTFVWRVSKDLGVTFNSWSQPTGCSTGLTLIENGVQVKFDYTTGHTSGDTWSFNAFPQLPSGTLIVAPAQFDAILKTSDYTAGVIGYEDLTVRASLSDSNYPIQIFNTGDTLGALYIGGYTKFNSVQINIIIPSQDTILIIEYFDGSSWVEITEGSDYYYDSTVDLTRSGAIYWDNTQINDWILSVLPDELQQKELYWVRMRTSSLPSVIPTLNTVVRGGDKRFGVYSSQFDARPNFYIDSLGRTNIGGGNMSGCNQLQVNESNYVDLTAGQSFSLFEVDSNCSATAQIRVRASSNDAIGGGYVAAKTRGTLDAPLASCSGDSLGHLCFRTRVCCGGGTVGTSLASLDVIYKGNSTTCYADMLFKTSSGSAPTEKVRISDLGTGFGISSPTAVVHLKAGTTTVSPLKFTSGSLLGSPQPGAMEFLGNNWYGTTTGSTRKTFAFLESPMFTGTPVIPTGTSINGYNLYQFILDSGGTNIEHVEIATFVNYTASTETRLDGVEDDIDYISGVTDTKLPTAVFAAYTGGTIPWTKVSKVGSSLADLATRNAIDVNISIPDWESTTVDDFNQKVANYIERTQISGRLSPETALAQIDLNLLYIYPGNGYITYDGFHKLITWSGQTINTSGYTTPDDVGTYYVYVNSNGDIQVAISEPNNIQNIRLGTFYWAVQIGNIKQDGGVIENAVSRTSEYLKRLGIFIYDNGGSIQQLSANTTMITSTPCKIQMGLMSVDLPQVGTTLADISGLTTLVAYNSPDQGVNADFYYINKSFYTGDASIPTTYYNDPTQPSGLILTAYTFNFTYGSNIVTSPDDVRSVLPTGDTFRIYDAFDGVAPYQYETLVTGHTWDGTGTTLTLAIPYFGAGGTGHTAVVSLATKNIPSGKWVKAIVLRTTSGQLAFYLPQTYYSTKEEAIAGGLPGKVPPFDTTAINMAYVVYSAGSTTFGGEIYDIRPLPFSYQIGGQVGGGGGISNHGDLSGLLNDDHPQYLRTDGTRNLTGIQHYQSHPTFTTTTDLVDKKYVDDADALKLSITAFNTYSGTTVPATYLAITNFNSYSGATNTRLNGIDGDIDYISGVTNTKLSITAFNTYSGTTIPATYLKIVNFNSYSGTTKTSIDAKLPTTVFVTYTGTTAPATYVNIGNFNVYTGVTKTALDGKADLTGDTFTGAIYTTTAPADTNTTRVATTAFVLGQAANTNPLMNGAVAIGTSLRYARQDHVHPSDTSRLAVSAFNTYSGTTVPANYYNKTEINAYTGATNTLIGTKLDISAFNTYSGTTVPANYYNKTEINVYSAATKSLIDTKAPITSPTFLTSACAPTPVADSNNTCIATTAFITSCQVGTAIPLMNGLAAVGTSLKYSRQDHVHPSDTSRLAVSDFNTYSGTTVPANYYNKTEINAYTGVTNTLIGTKLDKTAFATFTGTTLPANYIGRTQFNTYTGVTKTILDGKADLTGDTFTGAVYGLTAVADTNTTQFATTAFVVGQAGTATPLMNGLTVVGTSLRYSRQDHVHPRDLTKVNVSGDTMTGTLRTSGDFLAAGLVSGSTVYGSTCLCSVGTTRLVGATTAASTFNASGVTTVGNTLCLVSTPSIGSISTDRTLFWNPTDKQVKAILLTGGSDNYHYAETNTVCTIATTTPTYYYGYTASTFTAGRYQMDMMSIFANSTGNRYIYVTYNVDGTPVATLGGCNMIGYYRADQFTKDLTLSAGSHCFNFYFCTQSTNGTICCATIRVKKIC